MPVVPGPPFGGGFGCCSWPLAGHAPAGFQRAPCTWRAKFLHLSTRVAFLLGALGFPLYIKWGTEPSRHDKASTAGKEKRLRLSGTAARLEHLHDTGLQDNLHDAQGVVQRTCSDRDVGTQNVDRQNETRQKLGAFVFTSVSCFLLRVCFRSAVRVRRKESEAGTGRKNGCGKAGTKILREDRQWFWQRRQWKTAMKTWQQSCLPKILVHEIG